MSKGKFEASKGAKVRDRTYATQRKTSRTGSFAAPKKSVSKLWPILAAVAGVLVVAAGILLILKQNRPAGTPAKPETTGVYVPQGMSRAELEELAQQASVLLRSSDLVLTLEPQGWDPDAAEQTEATAPQTEAPADESEDEPADEPEEEPAVHEEMTVQPAAPKPEEPVVLTLNAANVGADLNLVALREDLDAGKGKLGTDDYAVDLADYLIYRENAVHDFAVQTAADYGTPLTQPTVEEAADSGSGEGESRVLVIRTGVTGRAIDAAEIEELLTETLKKTARGDAAPEGESPLSARMTYIWEHPKQVDVQALYETYCSEPTDATVNKSNGEIIDDVPGFGFNRDDVQTWLNQAGEGEEYRVKLETVQAEITASKLKKMLFRDTLIHVDTNHTYNPPRTNNLILASKAVDGTIVLPGEVFSFNATVGMRTAEKGYQEAEIYAAGGVSMPGIGGGVCQVASTIYYACLLADLETVERHPHMFFSAYVPGGMDAAISYGVQDYKFRNNTPYPIRIDASVSGGQVHVTLVGTEWKDYTVKMSYEVEDTIEYETVVRDVPYDGTIKEGQILTRPYTGYTITTYRTLIYANGKKEGPLKVATSHYNKRDEVIAHVVYDTPQPTQPPAPAPTTQPPAPAPTTTQPPAPAPTTTEPPAPAPTTTEPPPPAPTTTAPPAPPPESSSDAPPADSGEG